MRAGGVQVQAGDCDTKGMRAERADTGAGSMGGQVVGRPGDDGGEAAGRRQRGHGRTDPVRRHRQDGELYAGRELRSIADGLDLTLEAGQREIGDELRTGFGIRADHGDRGGTEQAGRIESSGGAETGHGHVGLVMLQRSIKGRPRVRTSCNPASRALA